MRHLHAVAASLILLAVSSTVMAAGEDDVVAKLGTTELKQSQLKALLDGLDSDSRKQLLADPASLGQVIRTEMIRQAVLKEAAGKQWDKRPEVQKQMDRAREQIIVASYLNDIARPPADYPSEEEIKQAYDANKPSFTEPVRYHVAQIYVAASAGSQDAPLKKASELAAKAQSADFAQLASQNSDHKESASRGGDMGWLTEPQMIPELRDQLLKMSAGQVSKPIKSATGWHIVKLLESKPSELRPLSDVREVIASNLRMNKAKQAEQKYLEDMLQSQKFNVNEIAISALLK